MSASLPAYERAPSYHIQPQQDEQLIARVPPTRPRHARQFSKQSKSGSVALRLANQNGALALPEYGCGMNVEGA